MEGVRIIRIALSIITDRLLTIIGLALGFSLSCWAMWDPTLERVGIVALFSIYSYILLTKMEKKDERYGNETAQE